MENQKEILDKQVHYNAELWLGKTAYVVTVESALEAMAEYSSLKCQHLLDELSASQIRMAKECGERLKQEAKDFNSICADYDKKLKQLQEAADKIAEALSMVNPKTTFYVPFLIEALENYNKLKGK